MAIFRDDKVKTTAHKTKSNTKYVHPDADWYISTSSNRGVDLYCPYANDIACPCYFESRIVLKQSTSEEQVSGDAFWKRKKISKQKQVLRELLESIKPEIITHSPGYSYTYHNLCPEVMAERFGLYASNIEEWREGEPWKHPDGGLISNFIDTWEMNQRDDLCEREGLQEDHWMRQYYEVKKLHYTQCEFFKMLLKTPVKPPKLRRDQKHKLAVQSIAKGLWEHYPDLAIHSMLQRPEIKNQYFIGVNRDGWTERTLRRWISEVAPPEKRRPGRPKKKK